MTALAQKFAFAGRAFDAVLNEPNIETVLDIGSGSGQHAAAFRAAGKAVTTVNLSPPADVVGSFPAVWRAIHREYDCLWASHVLEHQRNPGEFLDACFRQLRDDGLFAVTVPPEKSALVGGHLTTWTPGRLLYHLILAGFDCREARVRVYGYNISVLVRKVRAAVPGDLAMDNGDLERLAPFFPVPVHQGMDGWIDRVNWS